MSILELAGRFKEGKKKAEHNKYQQGAFRSLIYLYMNSELNKSQKCACFSGVYYAFGKKEQAVFYMRCARKYLNEGK